MVQVVVAIDSDGIPADLMNLSLIFVVLFDLLPTSLIPARVTPLLFCASN